MLPFLMSVKRDFDKKKKKGIVLITKVVYEIVLGLSQK